MGSWLALRGSKKKIQSSVDCEELVEPTFFDVHFSIQLLQSCQDLLGVQDMHIWMEVHFEREGVCCSAMVLLCSAMVFGMLLNVIFIVCVCVCVPVAWFTHFIFINKIEQQHVLRLVHFVCPNTFPHSPHPPVCVCVCVCVLFIYLLKVWPRQPHRVTSGFFTSSNLTQIT